MGTCTMLWDLSQGTDEMRTEGGGGPTAAVQTFFEKHHKTRTRPPRRTSLCVRAHVVAVVFVLLPPLTTAAYLALT